MAQWTSTLVDSRDPDAGIATGFRSYELTTPAKSQAFIYLSSSEFLASDAYREDNIILPTDLATLMGSFDLNKTFDQSGTKTGAADAYVYDRYFYRFAIAGNAYPQLASSRTSTGLPLPEHIIDLDGIHATSDQYYLRWIPAPLLPSGQKIYRRAVVMPKDPASFGARVITSPSPRRRNAYADYIVDGNKVVDFHWVYGGGRRYWRGVKSASSDFGCTFVSVVSSDIPWNGLQATVDEVSYQDSAITGQRAVEVWTPPPSSLISAGEGFETRGVDRTPSPSAPTITVRLQKTDGSTFDTTFDLSTTEYDADPDYAWPCMAAPTPKSDGSGAYAAFIASDT